MQADYKNLQGRSAMLDCLAIDGKNREINIELQQDNEGAHPKRARYHLGLMDTNILDAGKNFDQLPESYVIFITKKDVLGKKLPILHISRTIEETGEEFGDQSHFIYVDSSRRDDTELGRLMHDLNCSNASDMQKSVLSDRVRELKETERGVENMCREMDEIFEEGELKKAKETALSMAADGMKIEKIAYYLNVNTQLIQKWINENIAIA